MQVDQNGDRELALAEKLAARVAVRMDRRSFFRKTAATTFKGVAVILAGGSLAQLFASPAWAHCGDSCSHRGSGCPTITGSGSPSCMTCGPSRCCSYVRSGTSASCNCASGTTCRTTTNYCYGRDLRHYSSSNGNGCWSCEVRNNVSTNCYRIRTITCCDCKTSVSRCNDPNSYGDGRGTCIGTSVSSWSGIFCD